MRERARWILAAVLVLVLIGLIAYARGDEHRRGDEIGALPAGAVLRSDAS
ncbi:MAG TPA: hypothetical protein VKA45_04240 [Gaiellaceae bacterium]|nr:hypothetical protein [Gaiellaceae bacterium]